jgi:hypothetical protein
VTGEVAAQGKMKAITRQLRDVEGNARLIVKSFFSEYEKTLLRLKVRQKICDHT